MVNVRRGSRQHQEGELLLDFPAEAAWELMLGWMVVGFKIDVIYYSMHKANHRTIHRSVMICIYIYTIRVYNIYSNNKYV